MNMERQERIEKFRRQVAYVGPRWPREDEEGAEACFAEIDALRTQLAAAERERDALHKSRRESAAAHGVTLRKLAVAEAERDTLRAELASKLTVERAVEALKAAKAKTGEQNPDVSIFADGVVCGSVFAGDKTIAEFAAWVGRTLNPPKPAFPRVREFDTTYIAHGKPEPRRGTVGVNGRVRLWRCNEHGLLSVGPGWRTLAEFENAVRNGNYSAPVWLDAPTGKEATDGD